MRKAFLRIWRSVFLLPAVVFLCLLPAFGGAGTSENAVPELPDPPVFWLLQPAPEGAEEILLSCSPRPETLRVNLFSGEEPIAASAGLSEDSIRIRLKRPLRAEETLTFYADGTGATGKAFSLQLSFTVSLTGELKLQLESLEKLLDGYGIPGSGQKARLPESLQSLGILKAFLPFAPRLMPDPESGSHSLLLEDSSPDWDLSLYDRDSFVGFYSRSPGGSGFVCRASDEAFSRADQLLLALDPFRSSSMAKISFSYDPVSLDLSCALLTCTYAVGSPRMNAYVLASDQDATFRITFQPENHPKLEVHYDAAGVLSGICASAVYVPEGAGNGLYPCGPENRFTLKGVEWIP